MCEYVMGQLIKVLVYSTDDVDGLKRCVFNRIKHEAHSSLTTKIRWSNLHCSERANRSNSLHYKSTVTAVYLCRFAQKRCIHQKADV